MWTITSPIGRGAGSALQKRQLSSRWCPHQRARVRRVRSLL